MNNLRYEIYDVLIEDVALEISNDYYWRKLLFDSSYNVEYNLTYKKPQLIPKYIRKEICENRLEFSVLKVKFCPEYFDDGLVIFEFKSKEFPNIIRYSGNNKNVI